MAPGDGSARPVLVIDPAVCVGSQDCLLGEPDLFALGDDGCASVIDPTAAGTLPADRLRAIVNSCPNGAIAVLAEKD